MFTAYTSGLPLRRIYEGIFWLCILLSTNCSSQDSQDGRGKIQVMLRPATADDPPDLDFDVDVPVFIPGRRRLERHNQIFAHRDIAVIICPTPRQTPVTLTTSHWLTSALPGPCTHGAGAQVDLFLIAASRLDIVADAE